MKKVEEKVKVLPEAAVDLFGLSLTPRKGAWLEASPLLEVLQD